MSIGAGDMMRNTNALKKCIQSLVLTTPIGLNSKNPLVEEALNKILKNHEISETPQTCA
jgi:hypothetical protein